MPHQGRKRKCAIPACNADSLKECIARLCDSSVFENLQFADRCTWTPQTFSATSLFWAWSDEPTLRDRFVTARTITKRILPVPDDLSSAYQPFMRMQCRWSMDLTRALTHRFRELMMHKLKTHFCHRGRPVFAIDGSRFQVPRTVSNEKAFSPKPNNGKRNKRVLREGFPNPGAEKKWNSPQIWVTLMWHVGTGLPWDWRRGESGSSERHHLLEMIDELPPQSLLTADAGFAGYDIWKEILARGHDLLIRVGANTRLLRKLGFANEVGNTVYLWPENKKASQPPIMLRLIVLKREKKRIYFVTSILSSKTMSDQQLLDIAKRRWGVEVFFRSWKQTFDKRKLRSGKCEHALIELDWALIGLWGICLLAQMHNRDLPPRKVSVANALRAVRRPMRSPESRPELRNELFELLSRARIDDYHRRRPKASRQLHCKKKRKKVGTPIIKLATAHQRKRAKHAAVFIKSAA
jgi:hypothetical protein